MTDERVQRGPALTGVRSARRAVAQGMSALSGALLIQVDANNTQSIKGQAALTERPSSGLVLTGPHAAQVAGTLRVQGYAGLLLADDARYSHAGRSYVDGTFDLASVKRQRQAKTTVPLACLGYLPSDGDLTKLGDALTLLAETAPDAVPVLGLASSWLTDGPRRRSLAEVLEASKALGIALALEHRNDPLGTKAALAGFLALIAVDIPVVLLRSDGSALGGMAHGLHAAAVGTRSALRHLYPQQAGGGSPGVSDEAVFFPAGESFLGATKLGLGASVDEADPRWLCQCSEHANANLSDFLAKPVDVERVRRHNTESLLLERDDLMSVPAPQRRAVWRARCASAVFTYEEIRAARLAWPTPAALVHWAAA